MKRIIALVLALSVLWLPMEARRRTIPKITVVAGSPPTFVRKVDGVFGTTGTTFTISSMNVTGTGRCLIVKVHAAGNAPGAAVTGVAFNTTENFTSLGTAPNFDTDGQLSYWYLLNPTVTTANIVVTTNGNQSEIAMVGELYNGSTTAPSGFNVQNTLDPSTTTTPSVVITSATTGFITGSIDVYTNAGTPTYTQGGGQTLIDTSNLNVGAQTGMIGFTKAAAAGTTTLSITISSGQPASIVGCQINP